ncbi:hypothetical protein GMOD_00008900 [Pyrenophora seminiperda CCB06]|uniref:Uncharacterized protein n=1 Tax=Pyrenophora seminiperda CCB06 TaxID=1302712 RepID=A0A3M7M669_9PLEO|nr:hypothetical protein GMOD_00008900 [Pyrenophora seminiperda CCB06]
MGLVAFQHKLPTYFANQEKKINTVKMHFTTTIFTITLALCGSVAAQSTSILTVTPYCAPAPTDVMVTRSAVVVPACSGGANETKPVIVSMSGTGMNSGMMPTATMSGGGAMFTGGAAPAARGLGMGAAVGAGVVGGLVALVMG